MRCPSTGLLACIRFREGGSIKGTLEQAAPPPDQQVPSGAVATAAAAVAAVASTVVGTVVGGGGSGGSGDTAKYTRLGSFSGSWRGEVHVTCPGLVRRVAEHPHRLNANGWMWLHVALYRTVR